MHTANCRRLCDAALQQPSDHCLIKHGQLPEPMLRCTAAMACRDSQVMQRALDTHDTVLRALLARYYGYEVTTEGDSFTMAFHDPVDAVLLLHPPSNTNSSTNNNDNAKDNNNANNTNNTNTNNNNDNSNNNKNNFQLMKS